MFGGIPTLHAQAPRILDGFDTLAPWQVQHTDDVRASLHAAPGKFGSALRLDFDFTDTRGRPINGYATAHRALAFDLAENYELSFWVRGDAPVNNLQFKLIDASGDNVWWFNQPDFVFPHDWQLITIKKRRLDFAWGPSKDRELKHSAALEFVVSSGRDGGKGSVYFDRFSIRALPPANAHPPPPKLYASSSLDDSLPTAAMDGDAQTAWRSDPARGAEQTFDIDFGAPREFGGVVLHWRHGAAATNYDVQFSDDNKIWHTQRSVRERNRNDEDALLLGEAETRFVRLALHTGQARGYALNEIEIKDVAWGASPNAFFSALARQAPRGNYPRGFTEQSYWTVVGVDGGPAPALISEDGAIEPLRGGYSIEPFVRVDDKLLTWADVDIAQSLRDDYLPMPHVQWKSGKVNLSIETFAVGTSAQAQLVTRYRLENPNTAVVSGELALVARPFQVNPPAQFLTTPGGVSPIRDLAWDGEALLVNGVPSVLPLNRPDATIANPYDAGSIVETLRDGVASTSQRWTDGKFNVHDAFAYASAALVYKFTLPPHAQRQIVLLTPITGALRKPDLASRNASDWATLQGDQVARMWRDKLDRMQLHLPAQAQRIADTLRTALAHILISRDGAGLRPGTRSYARSWIRDGTMMADALLRLGEIDTVRDYIDWYAPHQFANGKVPCCVDHRGADPVSENDSHGELIHLIAQLYRYGHDREQLEKNWPYIEAAVAYMDSLRASETGAANPAFKGLMPASISHEGYSAKPMHSYWDDFWALTGYKDAVDMAQALGKTDAAARIAHARDEFASDVHASIALATQQRGIDFIPGSAELGDFDATSITIALSPAGEQTSLPPDLLRNTFERYWRDAAARIAGTKIWTDYTPYEWRTVGAFVRLGWRDRAQAALDFFFARGARPLEWNQWAEVVGRELREIRFIGDMPHAWVASDFIRSTVDLFAYERDADHALILGAGVPAAWLSGDGIGIDNLRTPYGNLSYTLQQNGKSVVLHINAGATPPGGFIFTWPLPGLPGATQIEGRSAQWHSGELQISTAPAHVIIDVTGKP